MVTPGVNGFICLEKILPRSVIYVQKKVTGLLIRWNFVFNIN